MPLTRDELKEEMKKQIRNKNIHCLVTEETKKSLDKIAKKKKISKNELINKAIQEYIERQAK